MELTITEKKISIRIVILVLEGRIHGGNADELEGKLLALIDAGERDIALNCARLDYISSAGVRVLLIVAKKIRDVRGRWVLHSANENVRDILNVSGLAPMLPIFDNEQEALRSLVE
jgi:stage II sporulation protein AA (anti-sigma F factor antagonist)